MKMFILLTSLILAATLDIHAAGGAARLDVRSNIKNNGGAKANGTTNQTRSLTITVNNISNVQMDNLIVKYWFFTRDTKGANLRIHKEGAHNVSLPPVGKQVFNTENITSSYTLAHNEVVNSPNNNVRAPNGQIVNVPTLKRVEASGEKIVSHAVIVFDGEKVVAEYYSDQSLQQKMRGNTPAIPPKQP